LYFQTFFIFCFFLYKNIVFNFFELPESQLTKMKSKLNLNYLSHWRWNQYLSWTNFLLNYWVVMSIGPKSWASSSSFYKRSSEFLTFELRFCQNRSELRLYLEAQGWTVSCASELLVWMANWNTWSFSALFIWRVINLKEILLFFAGFG
jgi:hypothetical protein